MKEYITIYAILPSELYATKELTSEEKLIAERITALCKKKGHAWITNKALADMYGIREDTVSHHIKRLKEYGFIRCLYNKVDTNKSRRTIYLTNNIWDKQPNTYISNNQEAIGQTTGHNNNYNYKKNINNNIKEPRLDYDTDGVML